MKNFLAALERCIAALFTLVCVVFIPVIGAPMAERFVTSLINKEDRNEELIEFLPRLVSAIIFIIAIITLIIMCLVGFNEFGFIVIYIAVVQILNFT